MNKFEQKRFDELYRKHLGAPKLQGMSDKTIDAYSRALRRLSAWFHCCPDRLKPDQLAWYFSELLDLALVTLWTMGVPVYTSYSAAASDKLTPPKGSVNTFTGSSIIGPILPNSAAIGRHCIRDSRCS